MAGALIFAGCKGGRGRVAPEIPPATITATPQATPSPSPTPTPITGPAQIDGQAALRHVFALAQEIGPRPAGSPNEIRAAEYIRQQLQSYGYQVEIQEFQFTYQQDVTALNITAPQPLSFTAEALENSGEGQATAAIVSAGIGHPQDFPAGGIQGRIALLERGQLTFSDKVENAREAGAIGVIIYNNEPGQINGALTSPVPIPVIGITRQDGQELLRLAGQGNTVAEMSVDIQTATETARNVIGRPPSGRCEVIVGGHFDSVPVAPGGNDNASGTAAVLEIARVIATKGNSDGACFMGFGAEEIGLLGSQHFVTTLTPEQKQQIEGMVNLDVVGLGTQWVLIGSPSLVELAGQGAQELGIDAQVSSLPPGTSSDHASFIGAGIPAVFISIFGHPPIHTPQDTADLIRPELLAESAKMGLYVLEKLLGGG